MIIRVQNDTKRWGFYTPWTRRLYNLLIDQTGAFDQFHGQLGTSTMSQFSTQRSQLTLGKSELECVLKSKILITRAYGRTSLNKTLHEADSIVVIAGGSGISAMLGDLSALPLKKVVS